MSDNDMLFATEEQQSAMVENVQEVACKKYLTFNAEKLLFGVEAESVVEIIINHAITTVPMVPDYIRGIINLRGQIIPIIDIRLRLGMSLSESACIIVLNVGETQIGILVDSVHQIADVPVGSILPIPTHNAQKYVSGMASLTDGTGTMLVLDCPLLLHE